MRSGQIFCYPGEIILNFLSNHAYMYTVYIILCHSLLDPAMQEIEFG